MKVPLELRELLKRKKPLDREKAEKIITGQFTPKPLDEERIKKEHFRVTCVNPVLDIQGGAIKLDGINRLCGHGTGMTVEEMNENLIWKGKPYIRIPYCKYCYTENTVGILDDTPQLVGWVIFSPNDDNPNFRLKKLSKEEFERWTKKFLKSEEFKK